MLKNRNSVLTWMRYTTLVAVLLAFTAVVTGRAWQAVMHRNCADALAVLILLLTVMAFLQRGARARTGIPLCLGLIIAVAIQTLLGMLSVTWRKAPQIVTLHMLLGLATAGLLWWLWLSLSAHAPRTARTFFDLGRQPSMGWEKTFGSARLLAQIALLALVIQITLGGWTSANYAAMACPDFPTCQSAWWPHMNFGAAFQLWHPSTPTYDSGRLNNAARIAIDFTHRLGAIIATVALLLSALWVLRERGLARARWAALAVIGALALQLLIGIAMVMEGLPPWLAAAHNGSAALLLLTVLTLNFHLRRIVTQG